jgi:hypothetical protein
MARKPNHHDRRRTVAEGLVGHVCYICGGTIEPGDGAIPHYPPRSNRAYAKHWPGCAPTGGGQQSLL